MTSHKEPKAAAVTHVTTKTGRILRIPADGSLPAAAAPPTTSKPAVDPARRSDVLFRVRRAEGHQMNPWWMVGAFVVSSAAVIALLQLVPGGA